MYSQHELSDVWKKENVEKMYLDVKFSVMKTFCVIFYNQKQTKTDLACVFFHFNQTCQLQ